jgi:hypothetical protein
MPVGQVGHTPYLFALVKISSLVSQLIVGEDSPLVGGRFVIGESLPLMGQFVISKRLFLVLSSSSVRTRAGKPIFQQIGFFCTGVMSPNPLCSYCIWLIKRGPCFQIDKSFFVNGPLVTWLKRTRSPNFSLDFGAKAEALDSREALDS